jgi:dTDP-4-dehydrorhamnose 3,5-epimerase
VTFEETPLAGAYVIALDGIEDDRGFFARQYCQREFGERGLMTRVVQVNTSYNASRGTLRGLHYQLPPRAESKLVRCVSGAIHDVIVDLRKGSRTFGQTFSRELSSFNRKMMFVPPGFAHGFITLADSTELLYFMDEFYSPELQRGIRWNDERFSIQWPMTPQSMSSRDASYRDFDPAWHLGE